MPTLRKPLTCWWILRRDIASRGRRRWEGSRESQLEDNVKKWSGDHIIDPDQVPGVLFMNRPFRGEGARLLDLAPSILAALGVAQGPGNGRRVAFVMKILVLGLDCAAPELLFGYEDLPNIRRLMEAGAYGRLESVIPPITVPAWMCMTTSQDPGTLGVYGFRNRADHSYDGLKIANRAIDHGAGHLGPSSA